MERYTFGEAVGLAASLAATKVTWAGARLVRRPVYVHGKRYLAGGKGLTTGHGCRFDLGDDPKGPGPLLFIGDDCQFGDNTHIVANESVTIGDHCLLASKIFISDTSHGAVSGDGQEGPEVLPVDRRLVTGPVSIGRNVWLGENVCVLMGVTIGDGCIIGANAVVTRSIPPHSIAAGVPAAVIRRWDEAARSWERA